MSITKFELILKRLKQNFVLQGNIFFDKRVPKYYTEPENKKIWDEALSGEFHNATAKFKDTKFLPHKSLRPMLVKSGRKWEFKLSQLGIPFLPIEGAKIGGKLTESIELYHRGDQDQIDELVIDVNNVPSEFKDGLEIDLKLLIKEQSEPEKEPAISTRFIKAPLTSWKTLLLQKYDSSQIRFFESAHDDKGRLVVLVKSGLDDACMVDAESHELIPCKTFMRFQVVPLSIDSKDPANTSTNLPKVRNSLKHELTRSGKKALERVISSLSSRFNDWKTKSKDYYAPLVSLCQSSGSGKTKIAIECLKKNPGFYLVFRISDSTGYPLTNDLAKELYNMISQYKDPRTSLSNVYYAGCTIGRILDFFARILTTYVQSVNLAAKLLIESSNITVAEAVQRAIYENAKLFEENENLEKVFKVINSDDMKEFYLNCIPKSNSGSSHISVRSVANFINKALKFPHLCLFDPSDSISQNVCLYLSTKLGSFPFLFILDEADLLSTMEFSQDETEKLVNGFEVLRRALGYLEGDTDILFMTLGTKSDIIDLNPPIIDMSARFLKRDSLLEPITLNSNTNIFSLEYPITKIQPSYNLLQNPLMFKFLASLGHGLWGSFPFYTIVTSANIKLTNGSALTNAYFLPLWMIRTGISAQPLHMGTKSLVAKHMATLFDIRNDMQSITVSYPSEPVLAMSARLLIDKSQNDALFQILKRKTEAVAAEVGRYGEIFASMIVLRAIDCAPNIALPADAFYHTRLEEIENLVPHFSSLWRKKAHLLEPENDPEGKEVTNFQHYKVCTVADFLNSFLENQPELMDKLPKSILEGIVNASHMVNLTRDADGFVLSGNLQFKPRNLPSADPRIENPSRNVIDATLLKTGLLRQCGFFLPLNYYGLDFIIPVCLKNDQVTYIGIQVKRSDANTDDDVYKMKHRLHFVNCADCGNSFNKKCTKCSYDRDSLKEIYSNSLALLISLDNSENISSFRSAVNLNLDLNADSFDTDKATLLKALEPNQLSLLEPDEFKLNGKSYSFLKPLIQKIVKIDNEKRIALIQSLWIDKYVQTESHKDKEKSKIKQFMDDGYVHRQFCIATRGWKAFEHLFFKPQESFAIANEIMSSEGLFRNCSDRSDPRIIRNVLHDTSPSYFQYVDELWSNRNGNEENLNLEKLDSFEASKKENVQVSKKTSYKQFRKKSKASSEYGTNSDSIKSPPPSPVPKK